VTKRLFVGMLVLALTGLVMSAQSTPSIQGVWRVVETVGGRGMDTPTTTISKPQPGLYFFTAKHYSLMGVTGERPRTAAKDPNRPTLEEMQDLTRFVANAGTYEIKGDTITFHREVALGIANMTSRFSSTSTIKLDGNTLTLVTTDPVAHSSVKLTRVE